MRVYKCDITGEYNDEPFPEELVIVQKGVDILGVVVDLIITIKVDAFNGAKKTDVSNDAWNEVALKATDSLIKTTGTQITEHL